MSRRLRYAGFVIREYFRGVRRCGWKWVKAMTLLSIATAIIALLFPRSFERGAEKARDNLLRKFRESYPFYA